MYMKYIQSRQIVADRQHTASIYLESSQSRTETDRSMKSNQVNKEGYKSKLHTQTTVMWETPRWTAWLGGGSRAEHLEAAADPHSTVYNLLFVIPRNR
jgi:hypothetical protein